MTKKELAELIYNNFYNEKDNCIDITGLDFTKYKCSLNISGMNITKDLRSQGHKIGGDLHQGRSTVEGSVYQNYLWAGKDICQEGHEVMGDLDQCEQRVMGDLDQSDHNVGGNLVQTDHEVYGKIYNYAPDGDNEIVKDCTGLGYMIIDQHNKG